MARVCASCDHIGGATPTEVAQNVLRSIAESQAANPPMHFFAFVDEENVRQQAALSTARYLYHLRWRSVFCSTVPVEGCINHGRLGGQLQCKDAVYIHPDV